VDPGQLENALLNLVINARDAMPNGGTVTIDISNAVIDSHYAQLQSGLRQGRYALIAVTDNGTGMSAEVRDRAFDPFFTTKPVGAGTGLGLSMVYGFVKQSGGHVQIYSELGKGTTVRMYLPRAAESDVAAPQPAEVSAGSFPAKGERVLVVEDDPRVRRITVDRLNALGYDVVEAENGPAALEKLDGHEPIDLLFTDMVMPGGMSGVELARSVLASHPLVRVVFTTGNNEEFDGDEPGITVLLKPYLKAELAQVLRESLTPTSDAAGPGGLVVPFPRAASRRQGTRALIGN
jgi:CheY-like chemotaxis protein